MCVGPLLTAICPLLGPQQAEVLAGEHPPLPTLQENPFCSFGDTDHQQKTQICGSHNILQKMLMEFSPGEICLLPSTNSKKLSLRQASAFPFAPPRSVSLRYDLD